MAAALIGASLVGLVACVSSAPPAGEPWPAADLAPPYPADNPPTPMKIELGRRLFYDGDLSWDGTMSCATCHEQKRGFTDPNKTRPGFDGQPGERNIQTLANVAWFGSLTWGGPHVDTLEHQALIPIEGFVPVEMGFGGKPEGALAQRLKDQACYPQLFRAAFPERKGEVSLDTITMALSVFQRSNFWILPVTVIGKRRRSGCSAAPCSARSGPCRRRGCRLRRGLVPGLAMIQAQLLAVLLVGHADHLHVLHLGWR
jgi:cytochrome c553